MAQLVGHESVEIPDHLIAQFMDEGARATLKEHLEEKFGRVVLDFQEGVVLAYALRVWLKLYIRTYCAVCSAHAYSVLYSHSIQMY